MSLYTRENKGNSLIEFAKDYVVIDIETTGFSPTINEIIEIGALKVLNNEIVDSYHSYIKINNSIPMNIVRLTGISDDILQKEGKDIKIAIQEFIDFIKDSIIVGHNVNFDINFLYDNAIKYINKPISNDFIDTLRISKLLVKDTYNYSLSTLSRKFNIDYSISHRALADVNITKQLYDNLKYLKEHYIEITMAKLLPILKKVELLQNKKISLKSKFKYLDETIISVILETMNSKSYSFMSKYADILLVNDKTYQKLQEPLDDEDQYMLMFNDWMFKAQERMNCNELIVISETDFCNMLGIPITNNVERENDESNPLYQKNCVFTGTLERMNRKQAEKIVSSIGGIVGSGVSKKTSYLILGNNDYNYSIKNGKSSKHQKAEELQAEGYDIQIIPEDIFYEMIGE